MTTFENVYTNNEPLWETYDFEYSFWDDLTKIDDIPSNVFMYLVKIFNDLDQLDYKEITELAIVTNWKSWQCQSYRLLSSLYIIAYYTINAYALNTFNDEEYEYYWKKTD